MAKDLMEVAMRNEYFVELAMKNPDISNTFCAMVDRLIDVFGDDVKNLKISGPKIAAKPFDVKFVLEVKDNGSH